MKPNSQLSNRAVNVLAKSGLPATDALRELVADALRRGTTPLGRSLILVNGCGAKTFSEICQWAGVPTRQAREARFSAKHCCQWLPHNEALLLDHLCAREGMTRAELSNTSPQIRCRCVPTCKTFASKPRPLRPRGSRNTIQLHCWLIPPSFRRGWLTFPSLRPITFQNASANVHFA